MSDNANQSAFPLIYTSEITNGTYSEGGLSKREYFAAVAMQGLLSGIEPNKLETGSQFSADTTKQIARISFKMADAMIKLLDNTEANQ